MCDTRKSRIKKRTKKKAAGTWRFQRRQKERNEMVYKYMVTARMAIQEKTGGGFLYILPDIIMKVIYLVPVMFIWRTLAESGYEALPLPSQRTAGNRNWRAAGFWADSTEYLNLRRICPGSPSGHYWGGCPGRKEFWMWKSGRPLSSR